jgi:Protein of unknown function (DUF3999)
LVEVIGKRIHRRTALNNQFKSFVALAISFAAICLAGFASEVSVSPFAYFERVRNVKVSTPDKQNFIVLDEAVWQHARADLGDLRLYSGEQEIPYAIVLEQGGTRAEHSSVPILNKGVVRGNTQFAVDVGIPEYDNIRIDVTTENYIAQAKLEGENNLSGKNWTELGTYTIFNFAKEKLGSNSTIKLASPARFRFLRLTIMGPVPPGDIKGASIANLQENKAKYAALDEVPNLRREGKHTTVEWNASDRVPLDRVHFDIDPSEVNFRREVNIYCDGRQISSGSLSRIRLVRRERKVESEDLDLNLPGLRCKHYKLEIQNGDDRALRITGVHPQMLERRVYFDPRLNAGGASELKLYYADEKRNPPVYDFAKLFDAPAASEVAQAVMEPDSANAAYSGRPDDRPWTERHPAFLWAAMIVAVGLLGSWALKGFKS